MHESSPSEAHASPLLLRRFQPGDEPALLRVHRSAILLIASRHYTLAQIQAWAPPDPDPAQWRERMHLLKPFVALLGGEIVGYADLQGNGHIVHCFVSGHHPRRGIGGALMQRIHEEAAALQLGQLTAHVSLAAEGFFGHFGFEVVERQTPVVRGVALANALMRKPLRPASGVGERVP
jgi:putative acetyltransferase